MTSLEEVSGELAVTCILKRKPIADVLSGIRLDASQQPLVENLVADFDWYNFNAVNSDDSLYPDASLADLDPHLLVPTQEMVLVSTVRRLLEYRATPPPIKVVDIFGELRILDGHHRTCAAAIAGRNVRAQVLKLSLLRRTGGLT